MQLDTCFKHPKFSDQINGEVVDSWLCILSNYFKTCPMMEEEMKLHIASLQLEGIAKKWWDTHIENMSLVFKIGVPTETRSTPITSWNLFCETLQESFYPPGYIQISLPNGYNFENYPINQCKLAFMTLTSCAFNSIYLIQKRY